MTAHGPRKALLTAEWVARFAAYYRERPAWGVFHVSLSDGNYECDAAREFRYDPDANPGVEMLDYFDALTPSQRKRLGDRAMAIVDSPRLGRVG